MAVNPGTIAVALGRTAPAFGSTEFGQWQLWIDDALMLIAARLGDTSDLDQNRVDYVVREAVVAQIKRPDDATSVDVRVDDGAVSKTYRTGAGRVSIRDEWWDLLTGGKTASGAFSIFPSGLTNPHLPWCASTFGANYCSCGVDIAGYPIFELVDE